MAFLAMVAVGCKRGDQGACPPGQVRLVVRASAGINYDLDSHPLPTTVHVYQVDETAPIEGASFDAVWQKPQSVFGSDAKPETLTVFPGKEVVRSFKRDQAATHLVGVALFRRPEGTSWRVVSELPAATGDAVCNAKTAGPGVSLMRLWLDGSRLGSGRFESRRPVTQRLDEPRGQPEGSAGGLRSSTTALAGLDGRAGSSPAQLTVFELSLLANQAVESGIEPNYSSLRTTAGPRARASFGRAQLTVQAHLEQMARLRSSEARVFQISATEVEQMRQRGQAAADWLQLVRGRAARRAQQSTKLSSQRLSQIEKLVAARRWRSLVAHFGADFAASTGLAAEELASLARTSLLEDPTYRRQFVELYRRLHGRSFSRGSREPAKMAQTARRITKRHPELWPVLQSLGGANQGAVSLGHYLGVGDVAENVHGWYAHAAQSVVGYRRFDAAIRQIASVTDHMRHMDDVKMALAAVSMAADLKGLAKARLVARLARRFHGAPARAKRYFFFDLQGSRPRFQNASELRRGLAGYMRSYGRDWSDRRVSEAFDRLVAKHKQGETRSGSSSEKQS